MESEPLHAEPEILAALDRGDVSRALYMLCAELGTPVYRYCRRMLGDGRLADDVHQNVFAQAFEDLRSFGRRSSLRSWIFAIAHHRCLDALKTNRRYSQRFALEQDVPEEPDPAPSSEDRMATRGLAASLEDCLGRLEAHVRMAVLLRYQQEFSYEEISRISRERAGTLQARVARAMPVLRDCLESKGVEP